MAKSPPDQSRQPPNHPTRPSPSSDVTIETSGVGFEASHQLENALEAPRCHESSSPAPPPSPSMESIPHPSTASAGLASAVSPFNNAGDAAGVGFNAVEPRKPAEEMGGDTENHESSSPDPSHPTHKTLIPHLPTTSAGLATAISPFNNAGDVAGVGFNPLKPQEPAEEVWGDMENHESKKTESTCRPILDCNADSEGVGGTTERCNEMPSDYNATKEKETEVSTACAVFCFFCTINVTNTLLLFSIIYTRLL